MGQLTEPTGNEVLADRQTTHLPDEIRHLEHEPELRILRRVHGSSGGIAGRAESAGRMYRTPELESDAYSLSVMAAGAGRRPLAARDVIQARHSALSPRLGKQGLSRLSPAGYTSARLRPAQGPAFPRMSARPLLRRMGVSGLVRLAWAAAVPGPVAGESGREQQPRDGQAAVTPGSRSGRPVLRSPSDRVAGPSPGPGAALEHDRGPRRAGGRPRRGPLRPARRAAGPGAARRPRRPGPRGSRSARPWPAGRCR